MTRDELVQKLADGNPLYYRNDMRKVVDVILDELASALVRGDRIELRNFGVFYTHVLPPRYKINPYTLGEKFLNPETVIVKFKPPLKKRKLKEWALNVDSCSEVPNS